MSYPAFKDIQSMVFSGLGKLPAYSLALFRIVDAFKAREVLREVVLPATWFGAPDYGVAPQAVQVLFTARGLERLGCGVDQSRRFARSFGLGMADPSQQRALGDLGASAPEHWLWSDREVHCALWVYGTSEEACRSWLESLGEVDQSGLEQVYSLTSENLSNGLEHFGFRDGLSNPRVPRTLEEDPDAEGMGDFVSGFKNALGGRVAGPLLCGQDSVGGSYCVIRQIDQDVAGFWRQWRAAAGGDAVEALWLGAKSMGRWPNGMPLAEGGPASMPALDQAALRDFGFAGDEQGLKCPFGSHVRRSNPRDGQAGLPPHRILRRGRTYGLPAAAADFPAGMEIPQLANGAGEGDDARGLLFACLNTDIARQFEFVQQTWINNPKFRGLYDEVDPVAGASVKGMNPEVFTIPEVPFRRRICPVVPHIRIRGGGYFYLPSRQDLERLASLRRADGDDRDG